MRRARTLGRYRLVAEIAKGGMATVHLAVESAEHARPVALKIAHPHLTDDPLFVAMFLDEARLAARIIHPNVVPVYDVDTIDGELVMAMEYVEGASLSTLAADAIAAGTPLSVRVALRIVHDALLGLDAAHELAGDDGRPLALVHRDVSPQNLLVGLDGRTRIADFGVAKAKNRLLSTRGDTLKGKLRYLAPEQLRREAIDHRTDVFAAGIVLWEIISGQTLFDGNDDADTLMLVLDKPIPPPSTYRPEVRLAIDEVCLRALERDRGARFATAREFAAALAATPTGLATPAEVAEVTSHLEGAKAARLRAAIQTTDDGDDVAPAPATPVGVAPRSRRLWPIAAALLLVVGGGSAIATTVVVRTRPTAALATAAPAPKVEATALPSQSASPAPVPVSAPASARPAVTSRKALRPRGTPSTKWVPETP